MTAPTVGNLILADMSGSAEDGPLAEYTRTPSYGSPVQSFIPDLSNFNISGGPSGVDWSARGVSISQRPTGNIVACALESDTIEIDASGTILLRLAQADLATLLTANVGSTAVQYLRCDGSDRLTYLVSSGGARTITAMRLAADLTIDSTWLVGSWPTFGHFGRGLGISADGESAGMVSRDGSHVNSFYVNNTLILTAGGTIFQSGSQSEAIGFDKDSNPLVIWQEGNDIGGGHWEWEIFAQRFGSNPGGPWTLHDEVQNTSSTPTQFYYGQILGGDTFEGGGSEYAWVNRYDVSEDGTVSSYNLVKLNLADGTIAATYTLEGPLTSPSVANDEDEWPWVYKASGTPGLERFDRAAVSLWNKTSFP